MNPNKAFTAVVDRKVFEYALQVFLHASLGEMPGAHIPPPPAGEAGMFLTNHPLNRGMMAVKRELPQLDEVQFTTLFTRLYCYRGDIARCMEDIRFSDLIKLSEDGQDILVHDELTGNYAGCRFVATDEFMGADLEDLHRRVRESIERPAPRDNREPSEAQVSAPESLETGTSAKVDIIIVLDLKSQNGRHFADHNKATTLNQDHYGTIANAIDQLIEAAKHRRYVVIGIRYVDEKVQVDSFDAALHRKLIGECIPSIARKFAGSTTPPEAAIRVSEKDQEQVIRKLRSVMKIGAISTKPQESPVA